MATHSVHFRDHTAKSPSPKSCTITKGVGRPTLHLCLTCPVPAWISPKASSLNLNFWIFPLAVLGKSDTQNTYFGTVDDDCQPYTFARDVKRIARHSPN